MTTHLGGWIQGGDPDTWYPNLWTWLKQRYKVKRMLDVGSGGGYTSKYWQSMGCEVTALEGDPRALQTAVVPTTAHDFTKGAYRGGPFDLAWCCEVVEHIDAEFVPHILDTFASASVIVMTHGVPGQPGVHHVNCQPSSYWVRHLMTRGYHLDYGASRQARTLGHHYICKTGMVFTREKTAIPSVLGVYLLEAEWFPRRVFRYAMRKITK